MNKHMLMGCGDKIIIMLEFPKKKVCIQNIGDIFNFAQLMSLPPDIYTVLEVKFFLHYRILKFSEIHSNTFLKV